jgi:protein-S-isoprenylcysteine O-methyltransferase Ste14
MEVITVTLLQKLKAGILKSAGYLILLVQQIPSLGLYVGLMSLPLIILLLMLFSQYPIGLITELTSFVHMSLMSLGGVISYLLIITGTSLAIYSIVYLWRHKNEGLVTSGPYRFIRHPQYTGFLLLTLGFTSLTYWWLANTFGIGWLSKEATVALWFAQLAAYIVLVFIEDYHLTNTFAEEFIAYKRQVPSLLPFGRTGIVDVPVVIGVLSSLMVAVLWLQSVLLFGSIFLM